VNNSAWYGFKLWSPTTRTVRVRFAYRGGSHRYAPKLQIADGPWQPAELVPNELAPTYRLRVGRDTTLVFAQVPVTTADMHTWIDRVAARPEVARRVIGQSVRGRPIHALEIASPSAGPNYVFVIGRQHPPEITGSVALMAFVDELTGTSKLAADFRRRFRVVVVPMLNPDGVESGNWRHNENGVDLNRDWAQFVQPETRATRDEFLRLAPAGSDAAHFAIDFHSTRETVAYTMLDRLVRRRPTLMAKWLASIRATHPEFSFDAAPSDDTNPVSKNWFNRTYGIPSLTFEVGDDVDRSLIRSAGARAAQSLMELLLAEP
jgi:predicted deacylase